ncbi:hypothetical protein KVR01_007052 [Diaporthe batatas]|uniref:uncharacterized protein n=1 Tax=Diaporthe batatas TaxID=748121 RepID=UPI001D04301E|nr:uncharacterized protein KVR01_007052 [Diaporthe batatas]KAG8163755.1 hypothetical protein KVR01_007052 [Diaporthe batatas]
MSAPTPAPAGHSSTAEYVAQERFHRRFVLPATEDHCELQVSYADVGHSPNQGGGVTQPPAVLFIPGMFGTRYLSVWMHAIAEKLGVRVLVVDRPGMGHSTDVPLAQRLNTWIEVVPRLLEHLQINHVALAAHSAGTIYLLNTLTRCRGILDPNRPFIALIAPWVDPSHSQVMTMQMVQRLPAGIFQLWHRMPKVASDFEAVFAKATKLLPSSSGLSSGKSPLTERDQQRREAEYGMPSGLLKELPNVASSSMLSENLVGADSEALYCVRKGPVGFWGECDDYALFVRKLSELERSRRVDQGCGDSQRLRISAYFAETDDMIGKKGQKYMEDCWRGSGGDEFRDVLDFTTTTVSETDHDTVVTCVEVLEQIFRSVVSTAPAGH